MSDISGPTRLIVRNAAVTLPVDGPQASEVELAALRERLKALEAKWQAEIDSIVERPTFKTYYMQSMLHELRDAMGEQ